MGKVDMQAQETPRIPNYWGWKDGSVKTMVQFPAPTRYLKTV